MDRDRSGSSLDDPIDQDHEQNRHHAVHTHKTEQIKQSISGGNILGVPLGSADQSINNLLLAGNFGSHPSIRDMWQRKT